MLNPSRLPWSTGNLEKSVAKSRRSFGRRIASIFQRSKITTEAWEQLEETLIYGDVGPDLAVSLVSAIRDRVKSRAIRDSEAMLNVVRETLIDALTIDDSGSLPAQKPTVILVIGINGSGKTTTVAKLAWMLQQSGKTSILAAADTFRAGAIQQLRVWGKRIDARVVAQAAGSDPEAVAFDAAAAALAAEGG